VSIALQFDCLNIDWQEVNHLLRETDLATYPPETLQRAFENSYAVVFALEDSRVIGSGRALSDGAYQAALYDCAVLPDYQGRGIGRMIIDAILKRIADCNIILYASPGKEAFHERFSFKRMRTGMALFLNPEQMRQQGFISQGSGLDTQSY